MCIKLSCYVLTHNSEKYLDNVLTALQQIADEIVIVDSGSEDTSIDISKTYTDKIYYNKFVSFPEQRCFAQNKCSFDWVFTVDSDEIPDEILLKSITDLKYKIFQEESADSYKVKREWYVMGKKVNSIYPVTSPDYVIRLYKKSLASFSASNLVHESIGGFGKTEFINNGVLKHYTFESKAEIERKLNHYTLLAAYGAAKNNKQGSWVNAFIHAISAFIKFYILKGGFKNGKVGLIMGQYAFQYTYQKYIKVMDLNKRK